MQDVKIWKEYPREEFLRAGDIERFKFCAKIFLQFFLKIFELEAENLYRYVNNSVSQGYANEIAIELANSEISFFVKKWRNFCLLS